VRGCLEHQRPSGAQGSAQERMPRVGGLCSQCNGYMDGMPGQTSVRCRLCVAESLRHINGWETHSEDRMSFVCCKGKDWQAWYSGFRIAITPDRETARDAVRSVKANPSLLDVYLVLGS